MRAPGESWPVKAWDVRIGDRILGMPGWVVQGVSYQGEGDLGGFLDRQRYVVVLLDPTGQQQPLPADGHSTLYVLDPRPPESRGGQRARQQLHVESDGSSMWVPVLACPNCNGNGGPWPEYPTMCGGVPCPTCDGVCSVCEGSPNPSTWDWAAIERMDRAEQA